MSQLSDILVTENRSLDEVPHAPDRREPVGFLLRLSKALHTYGLPAYELENTMNGCAEALGYGIQCMSLPTSISMTLLPPQGEPQTYLIRVAPGEVNLEKLRKTTDIAQQVIAGNLSSDNGAAKLKAVSQAKPEYPWWITVLAFAFVSGAIARIFSGGMLEIAAAGVIGLVVGVVALASRTRPLLDHLLPSTCAFLATLLAFVIEHFLLPNIAVSVVVISGLIILLPGLSLTIAMAELATQNMVSGTARLTGAATVFIQLAFGSALGVEVGKLFSFSVQDSSVTQVPFWSIWLAAAVAAIALVPLFEARKKDVVWFLLAALSAFTTVHFASQLLGPSLGAFSGAITVGLLAKLGSRVFSIPGAMIMMPGFIILVPGSVGYRSILALVEKDIVGGLEIAFDVAVIGISLVAGFLISSMVPLPKDRAKDQY
ncbi:threonine/serine ThrE exporter family protein [Aliikangiella coralliicola]|uniref:Threonine/serine exporter family protein n=1 Tax=Aliikangiella coralliicola TaxID=2592383 RepID=A0A545UGR9_9GAMM|nr:threonine/serine exporter family protein [Aliikangiella coralliicola]TQV88660.1 threonine/serine exporter family protein [Aliikangiella coralliicola]